MNILIITDAWHPQTNGVVRTYEHLQEELEKMGHDIHIVGPEDSPFTIPMPGYSEIRLTLSPYGHLKKVIKEQNPDHIHIATEGPLGWAGRTLCHKYNRNYSTAYHTQFPDYTAKRAARFLPFLFTPTHDLCKKHLDRFHKNSRALFVATQSLEDELKSWGFEMPMKRLTRGADLDLFRPLKLGERRVFKGLPSPVALYVGRVAIEKNIEDFLSMDWAGSKVVIGNGPSLSMLKKRYPDAHFLGVKRGEDLAAHYRSADVFVFPSRTDTFGIVLIEALASGLPIAGYDVTGPKDIVTKPFLGATHKDDLSWAAHEALKQGAPKKRSAHVKEHYTWEIMARQFEEGIKNIK